MRARYRRFASASNLRQDDVGLGIARGARLRPRFATIPPEGRPPMTTEQRLERLERENRWMRRVGVVVVAVAAAVFLIGQGEGKVADVLYAKRLVVVGDQNVPRGSFGVDKEGATVLSLLTDDLRTPLRLRASKNGDAHISFLDNTGGMCAGFGRQADGTPELTLWDGKRQKRVELDVSRKTDGAHIAVWDAKAHLRISIGTVDRTAALGIMDEKKRGRIVAICLPDKDVAGFTVTGGGFVLKDKEGKNIWTMPKED